MENFQKIQPAMSVEIRDYQQIMLAAWSKFTHNQELDSAVPPIIASSWRRCWGRINPKLPLGVIRMGADYLLASKTASFDLIAIARPVMEDMHQFIKNSGAAILLTNSVGYVLDLVGDQEVLENMQAWNIGIGSILSEDLVGTTSIGLALAERMPVQVAGSEHFAQQLHAITGAAAPMFDINGHLLGVLGIAMPVERYHLHSLGLIAAAARAIEGQRQADLLLAEQNNQLAQLNTILSKISDGILVWSADHVLIHANSTAGEMLGIPVHSMVGKHADTIFTVPAFVRKAFLKKKPLTDVEGVINVGSQKVNCLISLDFTINSHGELQWFTVTLRPEKKVRQLVQRQVGANAALTLDDIPGESLQMTRVRNLVKSAAGAQASVLIRGEAGTGKNALANAIHNASPRRDGPFVVFACASIPNELVISELLGYEEGGNDRYSGRPSKFELAEGGSLFFQDVDTLPLEAQAVLLNALEIQIIQRLGGRRVVKVDARVIASTSANIETLISQGVFRPDLYYRLGLFTIALPSLRERPRDIPQIVERILARFKKQLGYQLTLAPEVMDVFKKYSWPGNVREMEAVLGRAATQVVNDGTIELAHIPGNIRRMEISPQIVQPMLQASSLDEMERETILLTLQSQRGNTSRTAQVLGVSRTTLWRKLKIYKIDPKEYH